MTLKERIAMKTLRFLLVAMLAVGIVAPRVAAVRFMIVRIWSVV